VTELSFPRHSARTRRFTLGTPRAFVISPDGSRVLFLRSKTGSDPMTRLFELDVAGGGERLVVDPEPLIGSGLEELPPEERARRERARESSSGVVRFSADRAVSRVAFDLSGRLYVAEVASGDVTELPALVPVVDPRLSPSGGLVAYVAAGALRVVGADGAGDRLVAGPDDGTVVTYGLAEFVAAEEMGRQEG
jgi:dipeptidyl-peptidase 4